MAETIGRLQEDFPYPDCVGEIHGQPAHATVVDPPDLCLKSLSEGHDPAIGMAFEPTPYHSVDLGRADRKGTLRIAEMVRKVVVDRIVDADAIWIGEGAVSPSRFACAIMQSPKHRFGYPG